MSAFNPPYVRRTAAASGVVAPPAEESTGYYEPVMTDNGEYLVMGDGDIVMAFALYPTGPHNEIFTVSETPPGTAEDYYEGSETEPVGAPEGFRWYKPSDGVIYTRILDDGILVWAEL